MPNLERTALKQALAESVVAQLDEIVVHDVIDSTNSEAIRLAREAGFATRLVVAGGQRAGRGRRGREWISPTGAGVYMSLSRTFSADAQSPQALSLVTALSVRHVLTLLGGKDLQLKWPNDILAGNKKLAGILLEMETNSSRHCIVFGIGINIALAESEKSRISRPITDLHSVATDKPDVVTVIAALTARLLEDLTRYEKNGFAVFQDDWNRFDRYRDKDVIIASGNKRIIGRSRGVDCHGALVLKSANGLQTLSAGEIFPSLRDAEAAD